MLGCSLFVFIKVKWLGCCCCPKDVWFCLVRNVDAWIVRVDVWVGVTFEAADARSGSTGKKFGGSMFLWLW
jgi:hypothetical protein